MKHILCQLAQRNYTSEGMFFRHVSRCQECQKFFKQVKSLEEELVVSPGEPDAGLCEAIMAKVAFEQSSSAKMPARVWSYSPMALAMVAGVLFLVGILVVDHFKQSAGVVDAPKQEPAEPRPVVVHPPREMTLVHAIQQQKLLQRDALKLGGHLREHLILFRAVGE